MENIIHFRSIFPWNKWIRKQVSENIQFYTYLIVYRSIAHKIADTYKDHKIKFMIIYKLYQ